MRDGPNTVTAASSRSEAPVSETARRDPFIGKKFSHYDIEARLGQGGMGVVYRARDLKLGRVVAIKMLAPQMLHDEKAKIRFLREAQAASALDHPNIGTIYELGEHDGETFIVMAYYAGETLKSRLERGAISIAGVISILRQMAAGLSAAHSAGIVHRDIKPANVMLTQSGQVKLLDFGLAKLTAGAGQVLTAEGEALGTVLYASPEQLRGQTITHLTDLWSLGVVAYEMFSGSSPFRAESIAATAMRILESEPAPLLSVPGVPSEISALVARLLQKVPAQRFTSADDVISVLDSKVGEISSPPKSHTVQKRLAVVVCTVALVAVAAWGAHAWRSFLPDSRPSVAVLPFENFTQNPAEEYFINGMTEEIQAALSKVDGLRVAAVTSSFAFKDKEIDPSMVARRLGVDNLVRGSIFRLEGRLGIALKLISARENSILWMKTYNREVTNALAVQDEIVQDIVRALPAKLKIAQNFGPAKLPTRSVEAQDRYFKARYFYSRGKKKDLDQSLKLYNQALEKDPEYALAYVGIAEVYRSLADAYLPSREAYDQAKTAVLKALEIDDALPEARIALGGIKLQYDWDPTGARREFERARAKSVDNPMFYENRAWLRLSFDAPSKGLDDMRKAMQLDPLSAWISHWLTFMYYLNRDYDSAIKQDQETALLDPEFSYHGSAVGGAYREKGLFKEAIEAFAREKLDRPSWGLATTYAKMGRYSEAREIAEKLEPLFRTNLFTSRQQDDSEPPAYVGAEEIAAIYAALGDRDRAFDWLDKAYQARSANMLALKLWPEWDPIRDDPRFALLLERVGLK